MDRGIGSRLALAASLVVAAAALIPSQAAAAVKLGATAPYFTSGENCGTNVTYLQLTEQGTTYTAPADGILTSWSVDAGWAPAKLKVARPAGGGTFSIVAQDGPNSVSAGLNTFPIRISVRQGDTIGLHIGTQNACLAVGTGSETTGRVTGDPLVGQTVAPSQAFVVPTKVPVSAMLESDRDGDGYGDETQDQCPTVASTQGPCPLPTVLGQTFAPAPGNAIDTTYVVTGSPGIISSAQRDGVITSWSYEAGPSLNPGTVQLKTLRALGLDAYRAVGESAPETPSASTVNTFSTRVPIEQDDKIGIRSTGPRLIGGPTSASTSYAFLPGGLPVGSSATFTPSVSVGRAIDVSAYVEADADGDGYGDTSQDQCPTDASTQGACKTTEPPPGDDKACDAAQKKLEKAKAKLKKLKKAGASTKKVKSAKAKLKKVKAAVKKAC